MNNFWGTLRRVIVAIGPAVFGLIGGAFFAGVGALKAYSDGGNAITWGSLWLIGGGAAFAWLLVKAHTTTAQDWVKAFISFYDVVFPTPKQALEAATELVQPVTNKMEEKVLPTFDPAPVIVEKKEGI